MARNRYKCLGYGRSIHIVWNNLLDALQEDFWLGAWSKLIEKMD
jgi:hypothetical protein